MTTIKRSLIRKPVIALAVAASVLVLVFDGRSVFSQGLVAFANTGPFITPADRRIYDPVTCGPLVGSNWVAALYFGIDGNSINNLAVRSLEDHTLLSAIARFRNIDSSEPLAGTWHGGNRSLLDATVGQTLMLQVRVWDMSMFATYDDAKSMGGFALESAPFSYLVSGSLDKNSLSMDNFRGIMPSGCVQEPSVFVLAALSAGFVFAWQRINTKLRGRTRGSGFSR